MSYFDTYTALLRNEHVDSQALVNLYVRTCDLYNDLVLMGQPFDSAANQAKVIRDAAAERLKANSAKNSQGV